RSTRRFPPCCAQIGLSTAWSDDTAERRISEEANHAKRVEEGGRKVSLVTLFPSCSLRLSSRVELSGCDRSIALSKLDNFTMSQALSVHPALAPPTTTTPNSE